MSACKGGGWAKRRLAQNKGDCSKPIPRRPTQKSPRERTWQLSCREMLQNGSIQMVEFMLMHLKDQAAADTMQKGRSSPDNSFDIGGWVGRYPTTNEYYVLIWPGTCASLGLRQ